MTLGQAQKEKRELLETLSGCGGFGAHAVERYLEYLDRTIEELKEKRRQEIDSFLDSMPKMKQLHCKCVQETVKNP